MEDRREKKCAAVEHTAEEGFREKIAVSIDT
jgi:hypothetical protein